MSLSPDERASLKVVQVLFGKSAQDTKDFFESLGIYASLQYTEKKAIVIPYLGTLHINYNGDKLTSKGREAQIEVNFEPSPFLVRNVGQIEDNVETDAEKILISRFRPMFLEKEGK